MVFEDIIKGHVIKCSESFSIDKGKMYAVVGKNGIGKTTLLRTLSGNVLPDKGRVIIDTDEYCFPLCTLKIPKYQKKFREKVLYIEDTSYLYQGFTCQQNIEYYLTTGDFCRDIFFDLLCRFEVAQDTLSKRIKELSLGTKQKVSLSFALSSSRPIIILDEPTLGLDIESKKILLNIMREDKEKKGIVVSTNDTSILDDFDVYCYCKDNEVKIEDDNPYDKG